MRRTLLVLAALAVFPATAQAAGLKAPVLQSPDADATLQSPGAFTWSAVKGAATYEAQIAADDAFGSRIGGAITGNTAMTLTKAPTDGEYFWRVRAVTAKGKAGKWSRPRTFEKRWSQRPDLQTPTEGVTLVYPKEPLVLRWSDVDHAYKYKLTIATDPSLAHPVYSKGIETSGTSFAVSDALAPGKYYWAVTPLDARGHNGAQSGVGAFVTSWPASTVGVVTDLNADAQRRRSGAVVGPGAGRDVSTTSKSTRPSDFALGSKVCCSPASLGTTLSPTTLLPNNTYYWRVRAIDVNGNPGPVERGPELPKVFDTSRRRPDAADPRQPRDPADDLDDGTPACSTSRTRSSAWDPVPGASSYEVRSRSTTGTATGRPRSSTPTRAVARRPAPRGHSATHRPSSPPGPAGVASEPRRTRGWLIDGEQLLRAASWRSPVRTSNDHDVVSELTPLGGAERARRSTSIAPAAGEPGTPDHDGRRLRHAERRANGTSRARCSRGSALGDAGSYWVVIARDEAFTNVVEVGFTRRPTYALRRHAHGRDDAYYWAVLPADRHERQRRRRDSTPPSTARGFQKRSVPPTRSRPPRAAEVTGQPQFRWTRRRGREEYRLQVATDAAFGDARRRHHDGGDVVHADRDATRSTPRSTGASRRSTVTASA